MYVYWLTRSTSTRPDQVLCWDAKAKAIRLRRRLNERTDGQAAVEERLTGTDLSRDEQVPGSEHPHVWRFLRLSPPKLSKTPCTSACQKLKATFAKTANV